MIRLYLRMPHFIGGSYDFIGGFGYFISGSYDFIGGINQFIGGFGILFGAMPLYHFSAIFLVSTFISHKKAAEDDLASTAAYDYF
ncbi:hypothetical protein GCM10009001_35010 [Virgibacillus siamensis]|uniref:Uncharacterized protein n=1 Tax=Virgibacillus siamensis TaxID=480071 RepID=A0ABN1GMQ4_9BACI